MSPYEILVEGGGNEHFNQETGQVWLQRAITQWPSNVWINPTKEEHWNYSQSTNIIKEIFSFFEQLDRKKDTIKNNKKILKKFIC